MSGRSNRLYLDCSVYGGAFDPEFEARTLPLFGQIRSGFYRLVVSSLVEQEVILAPPHVVKLYREMELTAEALTVSTEVRELQLAYLDHHIVGRGHFRDAQHVALATVAECRAIVSWNFRHIVHLDKIPLYNAVNRLLGYNDLAIHSPAEVLLYEDR